MSKPDLFVTPVEAAAKTSAEKRPDGVTKRDLARRIADKTGVSLETAAHVISTFLDEAVQAVRDNGRLELRNFGVFALKERQARLGRNPRTGVSVNIPQRRTITFKPGTNVVYDLNRK